MKRNNGHFLHMAFPNSESADAQHKAEVNHSLINISSLASLLCTLNQSNTMY